MIVAFRSANSRFFAERKTTIVAVPNRRIRQLFMTGWKPIPLMNPYWLIDITGFNTTALWAIAITAVACAVLLAWPLRRTPLCRAALIGTAVTLFAAPVNSLGSDPWWGTPWPSLYITTAVVAGEFEGAWAFFSSSSGFHQWDGACLPPSPGTSVCRLQIELPGLRRTRRPNSRLLHRRVVADVARLQTDAPQTSELWRVQLQSCKHAALSA